MVRDTSPTCAPRASRSSSTPSTSSTATAPTATTPSRCCGRRPRPGAEVVALCDTNGGMLPDWVADVVHDVVETTGVRVGIHCHNDTGCAVANTLAAVDAGATHVQGTINGYGERTGNADLVAVVANLELKLDRPGAAGRAARATPPGSRTRSPRSPTSRRRRGSRTSASSAFAHKAGLHASAIKVDPNLYQHIDPVGVGNDMRLLVSDMAGRRQHRAQGPRARLRPVRRPGAGRPGHRAGQGAGGRAATRSRRRTRRSSCCSPRRSRAGARRTSTSSRGG